MIMAAPVLAEAEQDSLLSDSVTVNALRIFLDCSDCDFDYFDLLYLIDYIFTGGPPPVPPLPDSWR